jgi:hypothetical protein
MRFLLLPVGRLRLNPLFYFQKRMISEKAERWQLFEFEPCEHGGVNPTKKFC